MKWLGGQARPLGEADDEAKTENKVMGFANSVNDSGKQSIAGKPPIDKKGKGNEQDEKGASLEIGDKAGKKSSTASQESGESSNKANTASQDVGKSSGENDRG